jgi:hypothetical protein
MSEFYYCQGHYLDGNYAEHTCKKRDNCKYYDEDFYRKYADMLDRFDFLVCFEPCPYFIPRREERKCELSEEDDPFATLKQHVLR